MMPTKTSAGPNEVARLEVLRLAPPLRTAPEGFTAHEMMPSYTRGAQPQAWFYSVMGFFGLVLLRSAVLRCVMRYVYTGTKV
jgi:hypothetical protein